MNCKKCGSPIYENEEFCKNCGERVSSDTQNSYDQLYNSIDNINEFASKNYKLILNRKRSFVGCLIKYEVYIDNKLVGKIKNGQILEFEVSAGTHQVSINKNRPVNITVNSDITADVVAFGSNNFGITNVSGQNVNSIDIYVLKSKKAANVVLIFSIILPIISVILYFLTHYYIAFWLYAIVIGYAIVNIIGLKNQKESNSYKKLLIINIISIILSLIALATTAYLTI